MLQKRSWDQCGSQMRQEAAALRTREEQTKVLTVGTGAQPGGAAGSIPPHLHARDLGAQLGSAQHLANRRGFMPGGCSWVVLLHPAVHPEVAPMGTRGHGHLCSQHSAAAQAAPEGTNPAKCWPTGQETHAHPKEMALHPPNLITPRLSQQCSSFWVGSFPVSYARVRAQA